MANKTGNPQKEDGHTAIAHELLEAIDSEYVLENKPKNPNRVEFASYKVWIDKNTFLPKKAEYTDRKGNMYRRIAAKNVEEIQGYPTITEIVAEDLASGSKTTILFSGIKYDVGLNEKLFTERFLRRPPREVTR